MQNADGAGLGVIGAERIGTDEFGEVLRMMRGGFSCRAHFVQQHGNPLPRDLPSSLAARKAAADHMDRLQGRWTTLWLGHVPEFKAISLRGEKDSPQNASPRWGRLKKKAPAGEDRRALLTEEGA